MNFSIKTKISVVIALLITAVAIINIAFFTKHSHYQIENTLIEKGKALGFSLAKAAEEGIAAEDLDLLKKAEYIVQGEDVILSQIYSTTWDAVDAYPFDKLQDPPMPEAIGHFKNSNSMFYKKINNLYDFYVPVLFKHDVNSATILIGYARLTLSSSGMDKELRKTLFTDILTSVIFALLAMIALNLLLNRLVVTPILTLRESIVNFQDSEVRDIVPVNSKDEIGDVISAFNRNTVQRRKAEEERERLISELDIKNRELEQIIYATSHDLRTPLVNINGYSRELKRTLDDIAKVVKSKEISCEIRQEISLLAAELPESFDFISTSVTRMDVLLKGLLHFSRSGRAELKKEDIDMNVLINEIAGNLNYRLKDAGASLEVDSLPRCTGDREQINRIFSNLMENAIKYLDPARKGVIKVAGHKQDKRSVYCVEDNGIGIASEHQKQIFHIFHQLDTTKTGEGLGLAIVQRMAERHGGKIWVESEAGKGSRFYVALPYKAG